MNRIVLGAVGALLLAGAGIFWWQGRAETQHGATLPAALPTSLADDALPGVDGSGLRGAAPPAQDEVTREQRRFDRLGRNRDAKITRVEMLSPRVAAFRQLDTDHNNLLSFEEWAVKTSDRFRGADRNSDQALTREEFATTKPKPVKREECRCTPIRRPVRAARSAVGSGDSPDDGEPAD
ncbi:MAG: hypothetical protein ABIQ81_05410 [Novosphingobium sp.]